jgi:Sec7-like guanine-nucleotide exchange factor
LPRQIALEQFILHNYVDEQPQAITKFLLNQKGLSKSAIGELLGEPDQKYLDILEQFVVAIDFKGLDLVEALRRYLSKFKLPGEAQKID